MLFQPVAFQQSITQHIQHGHLVMVFQNVVGALLHRSATSGNLVCVPRHPRSEFSIRFFLSFRETPFFIQLFIFDKSGTSFSGQFEVNWTFFRFFRGDFDHFPFLKFLDGFLEDKLGDLNVGLVEAFLDLIESHAFFDAGSL